jgi:hypothetical protein
MGDISLRGRGRALMNKKRSAMKMGGMAMDESMEHEGMETPAMEARETKMEKEGYMENKKGKMIKKADMMTARMSKKKKGKMMRGKR